MIRVFLTPAEHRHFADLLSPPTSMRAKDHDTPEGQRELRVGALESVIGVDRPRERIAAHEFEVYGSRRENVERWQ